MTQPGQRPDEVLIDELADQLRRTRGLLTGGAEEAAEQALARLSGAGPVELRIAGELAAATPLAHPEAFLEAHRRTMRALEVLDRDGSRQPSVPSLGPLSGLAQTAVEFVAEYLTQSFAADVITTLRRLYARREAQTLPGSEERRLLARARTEAERLAPGFTGGGGGLPALVAGGAALPAVVSAAQRLGAVPIDDRRLLVATGIGLILIFFLLAWLLLQGAAVAHRRSRLIMAEPLRTLWIAIGSCGDVPKDDSTTLALVAVILTALGWIAVPILGAIAFIA